MQNLKRLSAWVPLFAGLYLLLPVAQSGPLAILAAVIPGALMIAGGVRLLVYPDVQAAQMASVGGLLGILMALPLGLLGGADFGLACLVAAVLALLASGWVQILMRPPVDEVPAPRPNPAYSAAVALDNVVLGVMGAMIPLPTPAEWREAAAECDAAHALFHERGYLDDPLSFHTAPAELAAPSLSPVHIQGLDCERLHFDSDYDPAGDLPGRERWMGYSENRVAHAVILRQRRPAPWLVCVHGYGMGHPEQDFRAFRAARLHRRAGVNVALFTLPVHGPRSPSGGSFGGDRFFGVSPMDFIHAETQAIRDLRRLIAWIRTQEATAVGVYGISLGGYTSALLAAVEADLACVIAGVPPASMIMQLDYMASTRERRLAVISGWDRERCRAVTSVVAPLAMPAQVPPGGRYIYAATGDVFVPVEHVHALWRHWERPRIEWCTGGHVTAMIQRGPSRLVEEALRTSLAGRSER